MDLRKYVFFMHVCAYAHTCIKNAWCICMYECVYMRVFFMSVYVPLYMYWLQYICGRTSLCTCAYTYICVSICMCLYVNVRILLYALIAINLMTYAFLCMYVCMYVCECTCPIKCIKRSKFSVIPVWMLLFFVLFNDTLTFVVFFSPSIIVAEEQQWYDLTHRWGDKWGSRVLHKNESEIESESNCMTQVRTRLIRRRNPALLPLATKTPLDSL